MNESGEELRKPAGFKEECRQDEEGQLIISGSLGEKQKVFLLAMTDMKSILVTGHDYQHSSLLVPAGTFSQKSASGFLKATVDTSLMLLYAMRSHIVYIEQGNTLMSGTIRDNLLLANPVATDEQLTEALHVACADFVFSLPAGMDTKIGEHATRLSGDQAQRIAIARSLLREGTFCCWMKSAHRWMPKPRSFFSTASLLRIPIRLLSVLRIERRWQTDARSRYGCDDVFLWKSG